MDPLAQDEVPNKEPVKSLIVPLPTRVKLPEMLTEPVNVCVSDVSSPNLLDPEEQITDELIVVTTNVCAVKVPLIRAAEAVIAPKIF